MSRVARVIKPKVKVHWTLNSSPRCNKKKPFPRDKVLVERVGGWSIKRSHQSPQLPLWMPFTFSGFLQHVSKLHVRKRNPYDPDQVLHCFPFSQLCSTTALKTLFIKCLPARPWDMHFIGFFVSSTSYFIGQNTLLWMNSELSDYCWVHNNFYMQRLCSSTMLLLYATVCPACAETISPLTDLDINEKFRYLIKH